jgi:hypothetical protein
MEVVFEPQEPQEVVFEVVVILNISSVRAPTNDNVLFINLYVLSD